MRNASEAASETSRTGRIDLVGHSMEVPLAVQQIIKLGKQEQGDAFVGVARADRGLWSCGTYPFNVWNSTCGTYGLPAPGLFLDWLYGKAIAARV